MKNRVYLGVLLGVVLLINSCKKQTDVTPATDSTINDFIQTNMSYWYYWTDKITPNVSKTLEPSKYFDALLYKFDNQLRPDGDRFSAFLENAQQTEAQLSGESKTIGARLGLYLNGDNIAGLVYYTLPNSPAEKAGIKRGDFFGKIVVDGQVVNKDNYSELLSTGASYTLYSAKIENAAVVTSEQSKTVQAASLQEDPMLLDTIYTQGNKKIAYLVYNRFYSTPSGGTQPLYDQKMTQIFTKFKNAGINEFILDLRYNGGGYISTARILSSSIVKNATDKTIFSRSEYNSKAMADLQKNQGANYGIDYFIIKPENIGSNLQRVYVLTSTRTASASELVINSLRPHMEVITIGDVTVGKNVGSFVIKDDKKRFVQGIMPIVLKTFNSAGQSDYTAGFKPFVTVKESISQTWYPMGDLREPLLAEAVFQITGNRNLRRDFSNNMTDPMEKYKIAPASIETEMIVDMKR